MVELMHDHGEGPSIVRERYSTDESGLHHLAFMVDDLDAATERTRLAGLRSRRCRHEASTTRFHFVDAVDELGHMIELYQRSDHLLQFYAMVRDAAVGWDSNDPVRDVNPPPRVRRYGDGRGGRCPRTVRR